MLRIGFDFEDKITTKNGKEIKLKADNFNKLLNLFAQYTMYNGVDKNGYTIISSVQLKKTYSNYKLYIDYMVATLLMERSNYIVGQKSYGYRLTESFKEKLTINKITYYPDKKKPTDKTNSIDILIQVEDWVKDRLKTDFKTCTIDFNLHNKQLTKTKDEWGNYIDMGKWFSNSINLFKWAEKKPYFKWKSGRLYTNFTGLSSHIRLNNVLLNNEPIIEYDISNSFPLMLAIYCMQNKPIIVEDFEFKEYCTSVLNGTFYSELQQKLNTIRNCNKKGGETDIDTRLLSRNEAKQLFQIYLNGDNKKTGYINGVRSEISNFMKLKYTSIHNIIRDLKDNGDKLYNTLVVLETNLIMNIVDDLYTIFNDIQILTCHDAIFVPQSFKEKTQVIWDKHIAEFTKDLPREVEVDNDYIDDTIFGELSEEKATKATIEFDDDFGDSDDDNEDEWDF